MVTVATRICNAVGRKPKTVAALALQIDLPPGLVRVVADRLVAEGRLQLLDGGYAKRHRRGKGRRRATGSFESSSR